MKIETDLKKIKETAQKKEDENWDFRSFLKGYDIEVEELDSIVHRLFDLTPIVRGLQWATDHFGFHVHGDFDGFCVAVYDG